MNYFIWFGIMFQCLGALGMIISNILIRKYIDIRGKMFAYNLFWFSVATYGSGILLSIFRRFL